MFRAYTSVPVAFFLLASTLLAQQTNILQQKIIELRQKDLALQTARQKRDASKELYEKGLKSKLDYEADEIAYKQAQAGYQHAYLALFSEVPHISIVSAVKSQTGDGRKSVKLIIKNTSAPNLDYSQLGITNPEVPLPDELKLMELTNTVVSLKNEKNTIISEPYEAVIPVFKVGEEKTLYFNLLDDVDTGLVSLTYAGKTEDRPVFLQKDASANIVSVQSTQYSQEADLGGSSIYDLRLERFTKGSSVFKLQPINLPTQIQYEFLESREGTSRLSQYRFPEGETTKKIALKLYLPELANERDLAEADITIDKPIAFYVLVLDQALADRYPPERKYREGDIAKIAAGKVRLELIPRGVGKIEVLLNNYFQQIKMGENIALITTIKNSGTRRVDNIRINTELPYNWSSHIEPDIIPALEVNKEARVNIRIKPPPDVGVGEYQIKIKTDAFAGQRKVQSEDKLDTVRIDAQTNVWLTVGLWGGLVALVLGIVVFGVKITRR